MRTLWILILSLIGSLAPVAPTPAAASTWPTACGQDPRHVAMMAAPCGEIDRAVHEAAYEFRIDEGRFRRMISCESHFIDVIVNGQFIGLAQEGNSFVSSQVPAFDYDGGVPVDLGQGMPAYRGPTTAFDTRNPFHNARLAARVISHGGYTQWECKGY